MEPIDDRGSCWPMASNAALDSQDRPRQMADCANHVIAHPATQCAPWPATGEQKKIGLLHSPRQLSPVFAKGMSEERVRKSCICKHPGLRVLQMRLQP